MMNNRGQYTKAFVLQFHDDSGSEGDEFEGTIEHVASGQTKRFRSTKEMLSYFSEVLTEIGRQPDEES